MFIDGQCYLLYIEQIIHMFLGVQIDFKVMLFWY